MFFNGFNSYTRELFNTDIDKHNIASWIIYNTNYQTEEYEGLKTNQCKFSYSVIEERCNISHKKAFRIMKELEDEGFISWIYKSTNRHKSSIIYLHKKEPVKAPVKEPVEEPVKEPVEPFDFQALKDILEPVEEPVKELVEEPVKELYSKNLSINPSKNLSMLSLSMEELEKIYSEIVTAWNNNHDEKIQELNCYQKSLVNSKLEKYSSSELVQALKNVKLVEQYKNANFMALFINDLAIKSLVNISSNIKESNGWVYEELTM